MLNAILAQALDPATQPTFWMPEKVSTVAESVDGLYDFVYYLSLFFFVLITLLLVLFIIKYRHREDKVAHEPAAGHSTALELTWTLIPAVLVLVIFYLGFRGFVNMMVAPPNAYEIGVNGKTWSWTFTYEGRYTSIDGNLHIPVNKPIRLVLSSNDVIHSLFLVEFRMKKDVVPGRYNQMWVEAKYPGTYQINCAEYCGDQHSQMLAKVVVHSQEDFAKWLENAKDLSTTMSPLDAGTLLYKSKGCVQCHSVDGSAGTGPTFKDMYGSTVQLAPGSSRGGSTVADENYIRDSILDPQKDIHQGFGPPSAMPSFLGQLNDWEIGAIIAYQKSISKNFTGNLDEFKVIKPKSAATKPATQPATGGGAGTGGGSTGGGGTGTQR